MPFFLIFRQLGLEFPFTLNEVLQTKKTGGFSTVISQGKESFFPVFNHNLSSVRKDDDGDFRRKKTREKRYA